MRQVSVKLSEGGRVVIPADMRKELHMHIGDELMLHMEEGKLILMTRRQAIQYVQEQMAEYQINEPLLSEQLIAERKQEARDE